MSGFKVDGETLKCEVPCGEEEVVKGNWDALKGHRKTFNTKALLIYIKDDGCINKWLCKGDVKALKGDREAIMRKI